MEIQVTGDTVTLHVPNAGWSAPFPNALVLDRGRDGSTRIVAVGGHSRTPDPMRHSDAREVQPFSAGHFDADVAVAFIRYLVAQGLASHVELWKPNLRITWPDWNRVPRDARITFLRAAMSSASDIHVNGRLAANNPFWRQVLGLRPNVDP
ncbi:MAG: hypothetical protein EXR69_07590 [Myxococcales bacterium]|nr:hypothetical protein [Myxococcales bacterium]